MTLKVYYKPGCPECDQLKEYLTEKGYEFETVNLYEKHRREERQIWRNLGVNVLPIVIIDEGNDGELIVEGFDKKTLEAIL